MKTETTAEPVILDDAEQESPAKTLTFTISEYISMKWVATVEPVGHAEEITDDLALCIHSHLASDLEAVEKSADGYILIDDYDGNEWRISDVESAEEDSNSEVIDLEVA